MDVYCDPPKYADVISASTSPTSASYLNQKSIIRAHLSPDQNSSVESRRVHSPLTESICIRMLNEESFASTATNTTIPCDNESINDDVFDNDLECDMTVVEGEGQSSRSRFCVECQGHHMNNEAHDSVISGTSEHGDDGDKTVVCITDKSQLEEIFKNSRNNKLDFSLNQGHVNCTDRNQYPGETNVKTGDISKQVQHNGGEINPAFLHDRIFARPIQVNDAYPVKSKADEELGIKDGVKPGVLKSRCVFPMNYKKDISVDEPPRPKDYVQYSCLVLVCCVNPVALVSFFLSVSVNSSYEKGQYSRSKKFSQASFWLSTACVLMTLTLVLIFLILFWPDHGWRQIDAEEETTTN